MKHAAYLLISILLFLGVVNSAYANSFFENLDFMQDEDIAGAWWTSDPWVYFGGCENNDHFACVNYADIEHNFEPYFNIGDLNVKQGVYQVTEPTTDHVHGKFLLRFSYKFITEEDKNSSSIDKGIMKLKNVDTNQNYYYTELIPADGSINEWRSVRVPLPINYVSKNLQLVFETINDSDKLTTLAIDNISFTHKSEPEIYGTLKYIHAGKSFIASGVSVKLKNRKQTKTYKTTATDGNGYFSFWPIKKRNEKYTIVATLDNYSGSKNVERTGYSDREGERKLQFRWGQRYQNNFTIK